MTTTIILTVALIFQGWFNYKTKQKFKKVYRDLNKLEADIGELRIYNHILDYRDESFGEFVKSTEKTIKDLHNKVYAKPKRNNKRSN